MMQRLLLLTLATTSALKIGTNMGRRTACQLAASAPAIALPFGAFAADSKEKTLVLDTAAELKKIIETKAAFIEALEKGDEVIMPAAIPFTTFQKLVWQKEQNAPAADELLRARLATELRHACPCERAARAGEDCRA